MIVLMRASVAHLHHRSIMVMIKSIVLVVTDTITIPGNGNDTCGQLNIFHLRLKQRRSFHFIT